MRNPPKFLNEIRDAKLPDCNLKEDFYTLEGGNCGFCYNTCKAPTYELFQPLVFVNLGMKFLSHNIVKWGINLRLKVLLQ